MRIEFVIEFSPYFIIISPSAAAQKTVGLEGEGGRWEGYGGRWEGYGGRWEGHGGRWEGNGVGKGRKERRRGKGRVGGRGKGGRGFRKTG